MRLFPAPTRHATLPVGFPFSDKSRDNRLRSNGLNPPHIQTFHCLLDTFTYPLLKGESAQPREWNVIPFLWAHLFLLKVQSFHKTVVFLRDTRYRKNIVFKLLFCRRGIHHKERKQKHSLVAALQICQKRRRVL